jgi:hypothetical protein
MVYLVIGTWWKGCLYYEDATVNPYRPSFSIFQTYCRVLRRTDEVPIT